MAKGITRERIIQAALDVLDERGADAVTVRAVAQRLDVKAPALYWHVRGKQELLDEMGTEIHRRVQQSLTLDAAESWTGALADYAAALRREYLLHRDGARTFSGTRLTDPEVLRAQEPWLRRWTAAGTSVADLITSAEIVTAFVVGFVIEEQERSQSAEADPDRYALAARDAAVGDGAPLVRAAGHLRASDDDAFERQLGIVMSGIVATFEE
ncbi:TetR/AcrR family transcriptional regulator C-terminal domain-containing protein [Microbacterium sp. KUDC0406]|uniref:TetR/AcrR family transcriptional regulator C-terminal domain-containing protein n=1 Tax=Microbacterium sp. KUDC0406 TaxID=2909588 RepID=UPI001F191FAC|nr:TetR/AcrR family transcriptional regulator C-terminal domain-containing protein [Microbacterium sp. KUDC0406]UJP09870.1 TetR/AcrR family transcriptional regulator C-terminal domain-containing protein [Microbacterium sp. KUDC0406]